MEHRELTIGIATYNGERFVAETVATALRTGAPVVVSDDGSTDSTVDSLDEFSTRIELIRRSTNLGIGANYQSLLERCETPLLLLLNQDDLVDDRALRSLRVRHDEATVMNGWVIGAQGERTRPIYRRPPFHALWRGVYQGLSRESFIRTTSQVLIPVAEALGTGGFAMSETGSRREDLGQGAEDWMCWLRLAAAGVVFRLRVLTRMSYRIHEANFSRSSAGFQQSRAAVRAGLPTPPMHDRRLRVGW